MKKHALLLIVHQNYDHLQNFVDFFKYHPAFEFYIHVSKKTTLNKNDIENLSKNTNVKFLIQKHRINWGGSLVLKATFDLAREAIKDPEIKYLHILSGQDFPIKEPEKIYEFFEKNEEWDFVEYFSLPQPGWDKNTLERFRYYNFYDVFDFKTKTGTFFLKLILKIQKTLGINRKPEINLPPLFGGSNWMSLRKETFEFILQFVHNNPKFVKNFKFVFGPEESLIHTILLNSPIQSQIKNTNLRYIDWNFRNGNSPAVLDDSDFNKLMRSEKLFARKFAYPVSENLVKSLFKSLIYSDHSVSPKTHLTS